MAKKRRRAKNSASAPLNWSKFNSQTVRRRNALNSRQGDYLATARALLALANSTRDREVERKAQADSKYFFAQYARRKDKRR